ncbi:MAG TPA: polysaccharide biosynthesis tyrosine autokinase [Pseudolabrys sp.]|nr:polysaccharide biosynthesis tyrosine autokinase [Pseudolabrys sp.]
MLQRASDYDAHRDLIKAGPAAAGAGASGRAVDLREMLQILRRRRWIVIWTTLALFGAALIFVLVVTPLYTATSTVLIDPHRSSLVDGTSNQQMSSNFATDDATTDSQVLLIQSPVVLGRAVDQLKLAHDSEFGPHAGLLDPIKKLFSTRTLAPGQSAEDVAKAETIEFLQRRLKVTREGTTFVIDINASSESAAKSAQIANAIADSYFYEQVHSKYDTKKIAASWLNQQIDELKSRVLASDKAVEEFRAANNLTVAQGVTVNDQQLGDLNNKLIDAHVQTAEARAKYEQIQNIVSNHSDPGTLDRALTSDVITRLRTQYADVAKNLADVSSKFGPQHPMVINARAQLHETQKLIDQEVHRILESTRQAYQVAKSREDALQKSLDNLTRVSNESGTKQVRLRELQREADANRTLYESFLARYKETSAQESLDLPDSRIVSKADIPIKPSFPKTTLILALALVVGAGFGSVLAFGADYFDRRVKSLRQAYEVTGLPTLAAMPLIGTRELASRANRGRQELSRYDPSTTRMLPAAMQPPLMRYVLEEPTSLFAESVRAVRLAIQRAARTEDVKTVMVSSSIDGEGKTTLAVNLAQSLAAAGMRTILVEGDLRNPEMSRSLCPQAKVGAVEVAAGQARFEQALLVDRATGLAILPSPPRQKIAGITEFVFSDAMSALLDQLRRHFDYVIVDSPPLVPLIDARALAENADRVVLAIRWDSTPQDVVAQALQSLSSASDRVLGTVLTRVDLERLRFYDYYQSSSYLAPYSYLGQPRTEQVP